MKFKFKYIQSFNLMSNRGDVLPMTSEGFNVTG
jgi:hypothetical protein